LITFLFVDYSETQSILFDIVQEMENSPIASLAETRLMRYPTSANLIFKPRGGSLTTAFLPIRTSCFLNKQEQPSTSRKSYPYFTEPELNSLMHLITLSLNFSARIISALQKPRK